ncbi:MAG: hypothetical protein U0354_16500 [Candidatus Sericytochromatia bacterium]
MYNFRVDTNSYNSIIEWLNILSEYNFTYEKMRIGDIKTRRLQKKASNKEETKKDNVNTSYMDIAPKENSSLSFEIINEFVSRNYDDIESSLDNLYETINYFIGDEDAENSIDFFK